MSRVYGSQRFDVVNLSIGKSRIEPPVGVQVTYARGIDLLNTAYNYLHLVPKALDQDGQEPQFWFRRRDEYDVA